VSSCHPFSFSDIGADLPAGLGKLHDHPGAGARVCPLAVSLHGIILHPLR